MCDVAGAHTTHISQPPTHLQQKASALHVPPLSSFRYSTSEPTISWLRSASQNGHTCVRACVGGMGARWQWACLFFGGHTYLSPKGEQRAPTYLAPHAHRAACTHTMHTEQRAPIPCTPSSVHPHHAHRAACTHTMHTEQRAPTPCTLSSVHSYHAHRAACTHTMHTEQRQTY